MSASIAGSGPLHTGAWSPSGPSSAGPATSGASPIRAVHSGPRLESVALRPAGDPFIYPSHTSWLAYDPVDASFWVAAPPSSLDVFTVASIAAFHLSANASYPVGSQPFGVAVDPTSGAVFVTNSGSNNVSILSATGARIGSVAVGDDPQGIVVDPTNDEVYVANTGSGNVTVLGGSPYHSVANITVGSDPIGLAYDAESSEVVVADAGSAEASVIDTGSNSVSSTVAVGSQPYGVGWDNRTGDLYVTDNGSANITVLGPSNGVVAQIPTDPGLPLEGVVYDNRTNQVYVGGGPNDLVVVDPSNESVVDYANIDPAGLAYDPATGWLCMTNTLNGTFECLDPTFPLPVESFSVTFSATGSGSWCLDLYYASIPWYWYLGDYADPFGSAITSASSISLSMPNATFEYTAYIDPTGPACTSSQFSGGSFTVHGPGLDVPVDLLPSAGNSTYLVEFEERGLPDSASVGWSVTCGGSTASGRAGTLLNFSERNGSFGYTIGFVSGYTSSPAEGTVVVQGHGLLEAIDFNASARAPPPTLYPAIFTESGLSAGTEWGVSVGEATATSTTENVTIALANGTYTYAVGTVPGFVSPASGTVTIAGADTVVELPFQAVVYAVLVVEFGLPSGIAWSATVANATSGFAATMSTQSTVLLFFVPNGTYAISVTAEVHGYSAHLPTPTFRIDGGPPAASPIVDFSAASPGGPSGPAGRFAGLTSPELAAVSFVAVLFVAVGTWSARRAQLRREGLEIVATMRQLEETDPWSGPRK